MKRNNSRMDAFLFGKKQETAKEEPKKEFNLMETAGTLMETYDQLSPYVKHVKKHAMKFLSK
ncbi:hypothetical protein SAMN05421503_2325 [Terribacillus aidingensis]|uniref:Uncharacterized protein n=1 Tax=Terribacillus aidingensis TaxID=586416 RepID=A0A285NZE1_9BACI|nr:hypothetical protein [Terribacillus aidingensis]SNZ14303.1 hypothetical protein SAMN05421503_2325 [Terribacillus aidingensis]